MKFGTFPIDEAEGLILAHRARLPGRVLKKGHILNSDDIALLRDDGVETVIGARLAADDLGEDEAAGVVAKAAAGSNLRVGDPFTGRCNLFTESHGVIVIDRAQLDRLNLIHEAMTIATVEPYDAVTPGQMVATIKIIPFAVPQAVVDEAVAILNEAPLVTVAPFKEMRAGLIMTRLPGMKESILDSTLKVMSQRLESHGSSIVREIRCGHDQDETAAAIEELLNHDIDLVMVFGASATVDREDVVPAAVVDAGGEIEHFGMPVDPGNLLFLGNIRQKPVIGMPGCARSPKLNGVDWVLWRVLAGLKVTPPDIMRMGAGGLLKEFAERPQPRRALENDPSEALPGSGRVAALLLAAGSSTRMGEANKLLAPVRGRPMVCWAADAITDADTGPLIVVTGHEADRVEAVLKAYNATFVHNSDYRDGLSTSLKKGIEALPSDIDGVIICLGDMPEVTADILKQLLTAFDPVEGRSICVPVFGRKRGNPVLWAKKYLAEMADISGDVGAKYLLEEYAEEVCEVLIDTDAILFDVDTPARLEELARRTGSD